MDNIERIFYDIPICTRVYLLASLALSALCNFEKLSIFSIYLNFSLVFEEYQYWRLITCFCFFGEFSISFFLHMFFITRYMGALESGAFGGRKLDFLVLLFGGSLLLLLLAYFFQVLILSSSFTIFVIYMWCKQNPHGQIFFMGLVQFGAPWLPFVFCLFDYAGGVPLQTNLIGIGTGHVMYFLLDAYPAVTGWRPLYYISSDCWQRAAASN
jgi:Derlin-2/3